jgi:hypothetical protein
MAELDARTMPVLGAGEIKYVLTGGILQLWVGDIAIRFEASFEDPPG